MTKEYFTEVLHRLGLEDAQILVDGRAGRWLAQVTSRSFAALRDGERQFLVWNHLLKELSDVDTTEVEFVFTLTPEELDQILHTKQEVA
jgi:hypothetical protein